MRERLLVLYLEVLPFHASTVVVMGRPRREKIVMIRMAVQEMDVLRVVWRKDPRLDTSQILLFAVIVYGQWESSVKQHEATS
jgi:hypothetical protein